MLICDKCGAIIVNGDRLKKTSLENFTVVRPDDYNEPDKDINKIVTLKFEKYKCPKCGHENILNANEIK